MRKCAACLLGLVVVAGFASVAAAQTDSVLFFDVRNNSSGTGEQALSGTPTTPLSVVGGEGGFNSGRRGAGQMLRLEPRHADGFESNASVNGWPSLDGDTNRSTGRLYLYMDVIDDGSLANDLISSIGLDIDIIRAGTVTRQRIESLSFTLNNDNTVLNSITPPAGGGPWNNKLDGTATVAYPNSSVTGIKAVAVPVVAGPSYSTANRLVPNTASPVTSGAGVMPYRLGFLSVTAGLRVCTTASPPAHATNSIFDVYLKHNNLLTTRVAQSGANPGNELVAFGYTAGALDLPEISGNTTNVASAAPDARIGIRLKGDFNGSGHVTSTDNGDYVTASTTSPDDELETFLGDFNNSRNVTSTDNANYIIVQGFSGTGAAGCP